MSEFFLELFSEDIPSGLQKNARKEILKLFTETFDKLNINFKTKIKTFLIGESLLKNLDKNSIFSVL